LIFVSSQLILEGNKGLLNDTCRDRLKTLELL
jgi:hypothetical protein